MAFSLLSAFWRTFELKKPKRNQSGAWHARGTTGQGGPDASGSEDLHFPGGLWVPECGLLSDHEAIKEWYPPASHLGWHSNFEETTTSHLKLPDIRMRASLIHMNSKWPRGIFPQKAPLCFVCVLNIFNTDWGCYTLKKTKEATCVYYVLISTVHNISVYFPSILHVHFISPSTGCGQ